MLSPELGTSHKNCSANKPGHEMEAMIKKKSADTCVSTACCVRHRRAVPCDSDTEEAIGHRFKQQIITSGYVDKDGKAHCISPLLYETGFIPFEVSADDGSTFPYSGTWLSVHHSKVSDGEKCTLVNQTKWQYYGTPNTGGNLTVTWTRQTLPATHVNIEVWGYQETDYGCDIEKGSVCTYHPGAVHCVRAIQASPQYGAGQQCCYDATGTQILTRDSTGGSTPDRGHDWGSPPFLKPPRIPGFSHWLYDVISFYYCCLWADNCDFYMKRRPSSDCRTYRPPRAASTFGDPHFLTFDGLNFTFNGLGEYTLVESDLTSLRVQGRTKQAHFSNGTGVQGTGLSAVAMQENNSDVIEVRYSEDLSLEVLLNQRVLNFSEQTWMDLKGLFLYSTPDQNITVMFSSGSGLEIRGNGGFLTLTILLPEKFINHTWGLFGVMNGNPEDDYTFKNKTTMSVHASPQQVFEFGASWAIENGSSLFTYDTESLLNSFFYGEKHNASFLPVFSPYEDPADPLVEEMVSCCGSDTFCRFDVLTTRSLQVGSSTRLSHQNHKLLVEHLEPVISCGWLEHPTNGRKNGTNYLLGSTIRFTCNEGYELTGSQERTCQVSGAWSGDTTQCSRVTGVLVRQPQNQVDTFRV
ncbi:hypothetical protein DUI87_17414 [Hirundo rustica rustica]|uniref:Sushi domain-containing protein n=1 Tax=Hirundo rustica rustica TaxID=333673 RepID=A0A3M0K0F1_HIRRU|nr:hypothetical protein DUI87_17414 [Hirundo rustica rustica]